MKKNKKILAASILGIAAGIAMGYLFTTEKGKQIREDIKDKSNEVKNKTVPVITKTKESFHDLMEEVRKKAEQENLKKYFNDTSLDANETDNA